MIRVRGIPVYWGIETQPEDKRLLVYSILHEVMPPFRHSTYGLRLRVSPWHWLHVGTFRYDKEIRHYRLDFGVDVISTWGFKDDEKEEEPRAGDTTAVEVRPVDGERSDQLH